MRTVRRGGDETGAVPLIDRSAVDLWPEHFWELRDERAGQERDGVLPLSRFDQLRALVHQTRERFLAASQC